MKNKAKISSKKGLPRFVNATTFKDLSKIIRIRSDVYPTNYIDLLLLENKNKKLSEVLEFYKKYKAKNRDFKTVSRIKSHIKFRQQNDGWIFSSSADNRNPIVKITGLKGKS
jgi:hypothetical protein